ncbi:MAG: hypothetical protein CM15mP109_10640 [Candidatus Dadabacteria bacterium]|nr:MAG: hypothetical protein CM15mP109_10640 [Candidatus Dadabacteria bacterium]
MAPNAEKRDEEKISYRNITGACGLGFGGIYVNPDLGGSGLSRLDASLILKP